MSVDRVGDGSPPPKPQLDLLDDEPGRRQELPQSLGAVPVTHMSRVDTPGVFVRDPVDFARPGRPLISWNVHQERPARPQRACEVRNCGLVVFDVLQNIERRNEIECPCVQLREGANPKSNPVGVGGRSSRATRGHCFGIDVDGCNPCRGVEVCKPVDECGVLGSGVENSRRDQLEPWHEIVQPMHLQSFPNVGLTDGPAYDLFGSLLRESAVHPCDATEGAHRRPRESPGRHPELAGTGRA